MASRLMVKVTESPVVKEAEMMAVASISPTTISKLRAGRLLTFRSAMRTRMGFLATMNTSAAAMIANTTANTKAMLLTGAPNSSSIGMPS